MRRGRRRPSRASWASRSRNVPTAARISGAPLPTVAWWRRCSTRRPMPKIRRRAPRSGCSWPTRRNRAATAGGAAGSGGQGSGARRARRAADRRADPPGVAGPGAGDAVAAKDAFAQSGLSANQCALVGDAPQLRHAGGTFLRKRCPGVSRAGRARSLTSQPMARRRAARDRVLSSVHLHPGRQCDGQELRLFEDLSPGRRSRMRCGDAAGPVSAAV